MSQKTYIPSGEMPPSSQIGATFEALAATIAARREAGEESYTYRLLTGSLDGVLKKVMEEAGETALAAKDVESWACSSLAASIAASGAVDETDELAVDLPPICATRRPMWCTTCSWCSSATASVSTSSPPS